MNQQLIEIKNKISKILSFDKENSEKLSQSTMTHTEHTQLILEILEEDVPKLIGKVEEMQKTLEQIEEIWNRRNSDTMAKDMFLIAHRQLQSLKGDKL